MIKRAIAVTIAVALVLAQSVTAEAAFGVDKRYGGNPSDPAYIGPPFVASATPSSPTTPVSLGAAVKNIAGGSATTIGWSGVNLGAGWTKSGQYLEVAFFAYDYGWGVQVYTDNMHATIPYGGVPTEDPAQQPAGLIGQDNNLLTCPMAILVADDTLTDAQLVTPAQYDPTDPSSYFVTGYDRVSGGDHEIVWFFLKDIEGTVWEDDGNGVIDTGEIKPSFNNPDGYPGADDYATIVKANGYSSGWVSQVAPYLMQRVFDLGNQDRALDGSGNPISGSELYSLNVYFAANFKTARESQEYKTETLTLELYHE